LNSCLNRLALLLKAGTAEHWPALGRLEWHSGFGPALGTSGPSLGANLLVSTNPLRLALLATLGVVLELLVVEKDLLAGCKNKLGAAVDTCEYSIGEFHGRLP
jgi:hypothetical protein